jgi:hypothetical protein
VNLGRSGQENRRTPPSATSKRRHRRATLPGTTGARKTRSRTGAASGTRIQRTTRRESSDDTEVRFKCFSLCLVRVRSVLLVKFSMKTRRTKRSRSFSVYHALYICILWWQLNINASCFHDSAVEWIRPGSLSNSTGTTPQR